MFKLKNIGKTKTVLYKNGKLKKNEIDWTLNTDNKNGLDLNINMNDDGNNIHYHQYLTSKELEELLTKPVINKSLEERLMEDFKPYDNNIMSQTYLNNQSPTIPQQIMIIPTKTSKKNRSVRKNSRKIRPKIIKIKIYTRKNKHHKHNSHNKSNRNRNRSKKHSYSISRTI
jgi:hypothetical protein